MKRFSFLFGRGNESLNQGKENNIENNIDINGVEEQYKTFMERTGSRIFEPETVQQASIVGSSLIRNHYKSIKKLLEENTARAKAETNNNLGKNNAKAKQGLFGTKKDTSKNQHSQYHKRPHEYSFDHLPDVENQDSGYRPHPRVTEIRALNSNIDIQSNPSWISQVLTQVVQTLWDIIYRSRHNANTVLATATVGIASVVAFTFCRELHMTKLPGELYLINHQVTTFLKNIKNKMPIYQTASSDSQ
eukprot:gb/GECH01012708.1/.p1 GENE.gb/GECH01012708.1/~~gb/GECH01012708.1/.p1  ORF type:complete len:247 (+),score=30.97 gb/GECH01012708.1/:1-741(+)